MHDYYFDRTYNGKRYSIFPLTFGRARLVVGPPGGFTYDDAW